MKPLRLHLTAFGPYADQQELDFAQLGENAFFLIHGATGSGKTSILDAICFALYGETSGDERDGKSMRSHHASPQRLTEVSFDFALRGEAYRVVRRPAQERPKARGSGTTLQPAEASLWRRTGVPETDEGELLASQVERVTNTIEGMLGFEGRQFRQVVVLPQGQFRRLLTADSGEREGILKTLFKTEWYERVAQALKEEAKQLEGQLREGLALLARVLKQAGVEQPAALEERQAATAEAVAQAGARIALCKAAQAEAQAHKEAGARVQALLDAQAEAERALAILGAQEASIEAQRVVLARAVQAATLADMAQALGARREEAAQAEAQRVAAVAGVSKAEATKQQAAAHMAAEEARAPAREAAQAAQARLKALYERVAGLAAAEADLQIATQQVTQAAQDREAGQQQAAQLLTAAQQAEADLQAATQLAAEVGARGVVAQAAEQGYQDRKALEKAVKALAEASTVLATSRTGREQAGQALQAGQAVLVALESRWLQGQAAILAQQLTVGAPCPVCGSCEHPQPATSAEALPSEADVRHQRAAVQALAEGLEKARATEHAHQREVESHSQRREVLAERLGVKQEMAPKMLKAEWDQARAAHEAAQAAVAQVVALRQQHEGLRAQVTASQAAVEASRVAWEQAQLAQGKAQAIVAERGRDVPPELRTPEAVSTALQEGERELAALERALTQARRHLEQASEGWAAAQATLEASTAAASTAQARLADQEVVFGQRLAAAGFGDEADFQAAQRDATAQQQLTREIKAFDDALTAAQDRLARARAEAAGLVAPDMAALTAALETAGAAFQAAVQAEATLQKELELLNGLVAECRSVQAQLRGQQQRFGVVGHLSNVANGDNSMRITFQRFVLAALLDDVLITASRRLKVMSKGRYYLQRVRSAQDRRRLGGLDLEVFDSYTGTTRPVNTLSGGESFLAALSLALGLAEVVQGYAGGMQLETIFIDEGFGSLDAEALDLAIQALLDLQQGGRLVGIISHVGELRERIPARLEITANRWGSNAHFVIP